MADEQNQKSGSDEKPLASVVEEDGPLSNGVSGEAVGLPDQGDLPATEPESESEPVPESVNVSDTQLEASQVAVEGEIVQPDGNEDIAKPLEEVTQEQSELPVLPQSDSALVIFLNKLRMIFSELNFGRGYLVVIGAGLVGFVLLVLFFVYLLRFIFSYFIPDNIVPDEPDGEVTEQPVEQPDSQNETSVTLDPGIVGGITLSGGGLVVQEATGIYGLLQEVSLIDGEIARRIEQLEILRQVALEDVFTVISQDPQPEQAYDERLNLLRTLFDQGKQIRNTLIADNQQLEERFSQVVAAKNQAQSEFFLAVDVFDGAVAQTHLEEFIVQAKDQVEIRAQFRAREKLIDWYTRVLLYMQTLITNVEQNRDALIKGVRVFDLGTDPLNLIINQEEAAALLEEERQDENL